MSAAIGLMSYGQIAKAINAEWGITLYGTKVDKKEVWRIERRALRKMRDGLEKLGITKETIRSLFSEADRSQSGRIQCTRDLREFDANLFYEETHFDDSMRCNWGYEPPESEFTQEDLPFLNEEA